MVQFSSFEKPIVTAWTSTVYTLDLPQITSLSDFAMLVNFHVACGASPTIQINALGAKALVDKDWNAVVSGAIATDDTLQVTFDVSKNKFVIANTLSTQTYTPTSTSTRPNLSVYNGRSSATAIFTKGWFIVWAAWYSMNSSWWKIFISTDNINYTELWAVQGMWYSWVITPFYLPIPAGHYVKIEMYWDNWYWSYASIWTTLMYDIS